MFQLLHKLFILCKEGHLSTACFVVVVGVIHLHSTATDLPHLFVVLRCLPEMQVSN